MIKSQNYRAAEIDPIPHICPVWYTTTLFWPVKSTPKSMSIPDVIAKIGQNGPKIRVLFAKNYTSLKKVQHRQLCGCDYYEV